MGTLGLAAGRAEGAPLRFASELARALDDGNAMRIIPMVTRGPFENINDLLFLRGVDLAIVYGDVLEHYKKHPPRPDFEARINCITHLFPSELHIFVRPEINTLADLQGKPVNFNTRGTAAAFTGPIVLERLGIKVDQRFDPHPAAMNEMAKGDKYAATVWVSTKPLDPFLRRNWPPGFKFLPVPLTEALEAYYLPAQLENADYPRLIPAGQRVETISVPAVLAVFAWPEGSDRHRRVERFIDYLADRLPKLQATPGFHPRWKELNLAAKVPGWQRFPAMQRKLDALAGRTGDGTATSAATTSAVVAAPAGRPAVTTGAAAAEAAAPPERGRGAPGEEEARQLLRGAGFGDVGALSLDQRRYWRGLAQKDGERFSVTVDRVGIVYSRRLSGR